MRKNKIAPIILTFVFAMFPLSCIKEDRTVCPCLFSMDFSHINREIVKQLHIFIIDDNHNTLLHDSLNNEKFGDIYEMYIPKRNVEIMIWGNIGKSSILDTLNKRVNTVNGENPDNLYLYYNMICIHGEKMRVRISMRKYYHNIKVFFKGKANKNRELSIRINSSTSGYNFDGIPAGGEYNLIRDSVFSFNIFRQKIPEELMMTLSDGNKVLFEYELGKNILPLFDYEGNRDLNDVCLIIDFSSSTIKVDKVDWEIPGNYSDITI